VLVVYYFLFAKRRTDVGILTDAATGELIRVEAREEQVEDLQELYYLIQDRMMAEKAVPVEKSSSGPPVPVMPSFATPAAAPAPVPAATATATKVIACPRCDARMKVPANAAGRRVACSSCQHQFNIP
jgi:hypothetical protein